MISNCFDIVFCCNVLNVVEDVQRVVDQLKDIETKILVIQIYEGDKSGEGKVTRDGFQQNKKAEWYMSSLDQLGVCERKGNVITIKK